MRFQAQLAGLGLVVGAGIRGTIGLLFAGRVGAPRVFAAPQAGPGACLQCCSTRGRRHQKTALQAGQIPAFHDGLAGGNVVDSMNEAAPQALAVPACSSVRQYEVGQKARNVR